MNKERLREKILEHSNSMFPLIDFFNDIGRNKDPRYDKERAYEDIEKIYDVFIFYKEKCEKLEKDYEKLKERYKHRAETSKDLCDTIKQYEKSIEILKENLHISLIKEPIYPSCANYYINQYKKFGNGCLTMITKEQYELLKEVLGND